MRFQRAVFGRASGELVSSRSLMAIMRFIGRPLHGTPRRPIRLERRFLKEWRPFAEWLLAPVDNQG